MRSTETGRCLVLCAGWVAAIGCFGYIQCATAAEVSYTYGYRAEFTDNPRRVPVAEESDMINVVTGGVTYQDVSPTLDIRFAPTVEYLAYKENSFGDEARLSLDSSVLWSISPERFTWSFEDNARQVRIDATEPATPDNTALANIFETGPDVYFNFNPVNTLQLGSRYGNVYVSDTDLDNQRYQAYARWLYRYSPLTRFALRGNSERVDFDEEQIIGSEGSFRRHDVSLQMETRSSRSNTSVELGRTRIGRLGAPPARGGFGRIGWSRRATSQTTLGLVAESDFSDTGAELAATAQAANTPGGTTVSQNLVVQDVFRAKRADVFLEHAGSKFAVSLRGTARRLEFRGTPLDDRNEAGGSLSIAYFYSQAVQFSLFGSHLTAKYQNLPLEDVDKSVGARFLRYITRNVSWALQVQREERESNDPTRGFVENRFVVSLLYESGTIPRRQ